MARVLSVALLGGGLALGAASPWASEVVVNGQPLNAAARQALAAEHGEIPSGAYWYDPQSGLWGQVDGPSTGRIAPGLALGGPLRPGASGGGSGELTGVFVNGREIHPQEYRFLRKLFGVVRRGRYWLGPDLVGGVEGGPPRFDLRDRLPRASGGPGDGGYNEDRVFGGLLSDGGCAGYLHLDGSTVTSGDC